VPALAPLVTAVAQTSPIAANVEANVAEHARVLARAGEQGARVCVFPELSLTGYELDAIAADPEHCQVAPDDPRLAPIREACRAYGVHALVGAAVPDSDGGRSVLGTLIVSPDAGGKVRCYAKRHLHGPELDLFRPGDTYLLLDVDGWRLGLAICYDAAVPAHAVGVRAAGADAYLVSALYAKGAEHRLTGQLTRAASLGMWAALSQFVGRTGPYDTIGGSGVWRPGGAAEIQLDDKGPGLALATLRPTR
jgi:predicted amidohydrolase